MSENQQERERVLELLSRAASDPSAAGEAVDAAYALAEGSPGELGPLMLLTRAYSASGAHEEAAALAYHLVEAFPTSAPAMKLAAFALLKAHDPQTAGLAATLGLDAAPTDAQLSKLRAASIRAGAELPDRPVYAIEAGPSAAAPRQPSAQDLALQKPGLLAGDESVLANPTVAAAAPISALEGVAPEASVGGMATPLPLYTLPGLSPEASKKGRKGKAPKPPKAPRGKKKGAQVAAAGAPGPAVNAAPAAINVPSGMSAPKKSSPLLFLLALLVAVALAVGAAFYFGLLNGLLGITDEESTTPAPGAKPAGITQEQLTPVLLQEGQLPGLSAAAPATPEEAAAEAEDITSQQAALTQCAKASGGEAPLVSGPSVVSGPVLSVAGSELGPEVISRAYVVPRAAAEAHMAALRAPAFFTCYAAAAATSAPATATFKSSPLFAGDPVRAGILTTGRFALTPGQEVLVAFEDVWRFYPASPTHTIVTYASVRSGAPAPAATLGDGVRKTTLTADAAILADLVATFPPAAPAASAPPAAPAASAPAASPAP